MGVVLLRCSKFKMLCTILSSTCSLKMWTSNFYRKASTVDPLMLSRKRNGFETLKYNWARIKQSYRNHRLLIKKKYGPVFYWGVSLSFRRMHTGNWQDDEKAKHILWQKKVEIQLLSHLSVFYFYSCLISRTTIFRVSPLDPVSAATSVNNVENILTEFRFFVFI